MLLSACHTAVFKILPDAGHDRIMDDPALVARIIQPVTGAAANESHRSGPRDSKHATWRRFATPSTDQDKLALQLGLS